MYNLKKNLVLSLLLPCVVLVGLLGCSGGGDKDKSVPVTGVTLPNTLFVQQGKQATLTACIQPINASNKKVSWNSDKPSIATISNGTVTAVGIGEATITVTAEDGGKKDTCAVTVTEFDPVEEAKRQAEFDKLSKDVNEDWTIVEVKQMPDFDNLPLEQGLGFGYTDTTHTARGYGYIVSSLVTDPMLKSELESYAKLKNFLSSFSWVHELRHGKNAPYATYSIIKAPKNLWRLLFLDETSAYLSSMMLFRKNMLEEYAKNPFGFSAWQYNQENGATENLAKNRMMDWYDEKNDFADLMSRVSLEEAALLIYGYYDMFADLFDKNASGAKSINNVFGQTNFIETRFDQEPFFQEALNWLFTYKVDGKDVNLWQIMGADARDATLKKLNDKMEEEYEKWSTGN
jgi:hypothetical protein